MTRDDLQRGASHRLADARAAFRSSFANANMRRAHLSFGAVVASWWACTVALSVVAFAEGGAPAVALVVTACMIPSALLAPFGAVLADRFRRDHILIAAASVQALASGGAAVALALDASLVVVCAPAVVAAVAYTCVYPAQGALLPSLCNTPQQLTSATVVRGLMDSIATLAGPALAAVALVIAGPSIVFVAAAAVAACSALLIARLRYEIPAGTGSARRRVGREALDGLAAIGRHRDVALLIAIGLAPPFTRGCVSVLLVVVAIDLLAAGEAAVGVLTAAIGVGAIVGSVAASLLADGRALARFGGVGVALWGLPLIGIALLPHQPAVLAFLCAVGLGNALVDVGTYGLPPRLIPDELLGRVFGVFESLIAGAVALGSLAAPLALHAFGIRGALFAVGLVCPICVLLAWPRLKRIDRELVARNSEITLLRRVPMLRILPLPSIERLAANVQPAVVPDGASVFDEGDDGDSFYVIADGEGEIWLADRVVRVLGPGDGFGEIALLRDCPRTATVRARGDLSLAVISRAHFLSAVTGFRPAAQEADETISVLLDSDAPRVSAAHATIAPSDARPERAGTPS